MAIVATLLSILVIGISIVSVVCWIMTLIKIFKESVGLGIVGIICGLFAFIYGWVKSKEYDNKKIMVIWTIAIVVSILLNVAAGVIAGSAVSTMDLKLPTE